MHCRNYQRVPINRRELLKASGFGFGAFAFEAMTGKALGEKGNQGTHHKAKAKNVIFLYMDGGVSHVDSFDPKPALKEHNGKNPADFFKAAPTQFNNNGKNNFQDKTRYYLYALRRRFKYRPSSC